MPCQLQLVEDNSYVGNSSSIGLAGGFDFENSIIFYAYHSPSHSNNPDIFILRNNINMKYVGEGNNGLYGVDSKTDAIPFTVEEDSSGYTLKTVPSDDRGTCYVCNSGTIGLYLELSSLSPEALKFKNSG